MDFLLDDKNFSVYSLYTNEVTDYLKPAGVPLTFLHQHLKNNANPCVCSLFTVPSAILDM